MADLHSLLEDAAAGDVAAQYALGNAYHMGVGGLPRHLPTAMRWYLKAAAQGHVDAQVNLGVILIHDIAQAGGSRNAAQAYHWFKRAAELGDVQAMCYLARMFLQGEGVARDAAGACEWLERAGEAGCAPAFNELGRMHARGDLGAPDQSKAAAAYERGARLGDLHSQYNLASCFLTGDGVTQDPVRAAQWYRAAADQGFGEAQFNLAVLLLNGAEGVAQDARQGMTWLAKAADKGVAAAQYELGKRLRTGQGVPADPLQAMHYYNEAAEQDHAEAQFSLALMLEVGAGLDRAYPEQAAQWYRRLAMQGTHAGGAHNLGILYAQGSGVPQDDAIARELFELAISLRGDEAMYSLGLLLLRGGGSRLEPIEAAKWAFLSMKHDPAGGGRELMAVLVSELTADELEEGRIRAARWERQPKRLSLLAADGTPS
jgi:TPR repeat protein